jgi:hypothetical protein
MHIGRTIAAFAAAFLVSKARGQSHFSARDQTDVVVALLGSREKMFFQSVIVDGCSLAAALGDSTRDASVGLPTSVHPMISGRPGQCLKERDLPATRTAVIHFASFSVGGAELIPRDPDAPPVRGRLVKVQIGVSTLPEGGMRLEEWVMRNSSDRIWVPLVVRISSIGAR